MATFTPAAQGWIDRALKTIDAQVKIKNVIDIGVCTISHADLFRSSYGEKWIAVAETETLIREHALDQKYDQIFVGDPVDLEIPDDVSFTVGFIDGLAEPFGELEACALYKELLDRCEFVFVYLPIQQPMRNTAGDGQVIDEQQGSLHENILHTFPGVIAWFRGDHVACYLGSSATRIEIPNREPPKVAVYAICKNEEQFVDRMIKSAFDADKIAIADTGSIDATWKMLCDWRDRHPHKMIIDQCRIEPWRFDVARNYSLTMIPKDIDVCVCLDLDEELTPGWRAALDEVWLPWHHRLRYLYVWNFDEKGEPLTSFWSHKVHSRQWFRWHHPVHEILDYFGKAEQQEVYSETFQIYHRADLNKTREYYLSLLETAVLENPDDNRDAHYLGREYFFRERWVDCIRELERHLRLPRATGKAERCASMQMLGKAYAKIGDHDKALEYYCRALSEAPGWREPWLDLAQYFHDRAEWEQCYVMVQRALKIPHSSSYITNADYYRGYPHDLLSIAAWHLGLKKQAITAVKTALEYAPAEARLLGNLQFFTTALAAEGASGDGR